MPRYHFNVHDGGDGLDVAGSEFADLHAAGLQAVRYAGEILKAEADRLVGGRPWHMEVTTAEGLAVYRLDFILTPLAIGAAAP